MLGIFAVYRNLEARDEAQLCFRDKDKENDILTDRERDREKRQRRKILRCLGPTVH